MPIKLNAGCTEMILVPIGVLRVTKKWSLKSVPTTVISTGLNSDSSVLTMVPGLPLNVLYLMAYSIYSVRRGFLVFARNCANCHGMIYKKYDALLDKAYKQLELAVSIEIPCD
jgi:hypothetical protein